MLARVLPDTALRYIHVHDDKRREIMVGGDATNYIFAKALGVLPDNNVKLFIGIEGPNDIMFLNTISEALRDDGLDIPDLGKMELDGELIYFPLGGSNLALWSSRLERLNRPEFHLYDRDCAPPAPPLYQDHVDQVNARDKCKARSTLKLEIENYLHKDAILAAYNDLSINLALAANYGLYDDVPMEVARLVHDASASGTPWDALSDEKKGKKESKAKSILCKHAPKYMNRAQLDEIDPDGVKHIFFADNQANNAPHILQEVVKCCADELESKNH